MNTFEDPTLVDLIERSQEYDAHKNDYHSHTEELGFEHDTCNMVLHGSDQALLWGVTPTSIFQLTHHALSQVCDKLGPPPLRYMRECPPELRASNLNYWRQQVDKRWLVRTFGDKVRAVQDALYAPVDNTFMLESANVFLEGKDYALRNSFLDADSLHLRIAMKAQEVETPNHGKEYYLRGVYLSNSEIGLGSVRILPFVQRTSCTNSTLWEKGGYVQRHYGRDTQAFVKGLIKEKLGQYFDATRKMLERMVEAEMEQIQDPWSEVERIAEKEGLIDLKDIILTGMEGRLTTAGIVHGFSYAANHVEDPAEQARIQQVAGAILGAEE